MQPLPYPDYFGSIAYTEGMVIDYDAFDGEWRKIGLSGPACRALVDAKLYRVSDLRKITLAELQGLHGMGKSSIARIRQIMDAKKIRFKLS